ncbi:MAG: cytidylate kinase family protein, partial [Candidatus Bathyarchaeia archaeon]
RGWWETPEGLAFMENRERNHEFDLKVDHKLLEAAEKGNVILDSWTMPWLLKHGFKIWLEASLEKRAERVARRDGISLQQAMEALKSKESKTKSIYEKLYGF